MSVAGATAVPTAQHDEAAARDAAGTWLARLTVAPTLVATSFLLASFPFLLIGWFRPVPVLAASVVVAAVIVPLGLRRIPGLLPASASARESRLWAQPGDPGQREARRTPWWPLVSVLVIAVAFFVFQAAYHSQFLIISRDPASYMQFATWISGHGSLPIPTDSQAFGNAKGLWYQSFAMYQVGNSVTPQFMAGLPMALSVGFWFGGVNGALLLAPFFGAVAIVVFAGLAARLLGARWAPLAALFIAASLPQMFTSRSTYSEPLAQILFIGGLALFIDSLRARHAGIAASGGRDGSTAVVGRVLARVAAWDSARVLAALAGLALGITLLVRIDGPADVLPVIPYAGLLLLRRQPQGKPLVIGLVVGWVWGTVDGLVLSWPYVFQTNLGSTVPMLAAIAAVTIVSVIGWYRLRKRLRAGGSLPQLGERWWLPRWLPVAAAVAPFVILAAFAARPHVQRGLAKHQYAQLALHWVYWYIGGPAIALAAIGTALLAYGCLRGRWPTWALPLMTFSWSILLFLYRPGITPDQPWASRRLVPAVLPGFILLAIWAVAWACGKIRRGEVRFGRRAAAPAAEPAAGGGTGRRRGLLAAAVASICAVLFLVPTVLSTFGISFHSGGSKGIVSVHGLALKRTFTGQVAAIYGLCERLPSDASVIIPDGPLADRIAEVVRGACGVPVARFHYTNSDVYRYPTAPVALVRGAIQGAEQAGRVPVLLVSHESYLAPYLSGGSVTKAMTLRSTMDGRTLLSKPYKIAKEDMDIWMWEPAR